VRSILFTEEGAETRVTGLVVAKVRHKKLSLLMHTSVLVMYQESSASYPRRGGWSDFDNIYKLDTVPVATVQLRFDGWVTELQNDGERQQLTHAAGIDNLLYTPDADFSCFADLALTSPGSFYREGRGRCCSWC